MKTKWLSIATLVWACLAVIPGNAAADEFWTFVEVNCNPAGDSFEIKQVGLYNEAGEALYKKRSKISDPPGKNGIYNLHDLLVQKGTGSAWKMKTLKKSCQLSTGAFVAEIKPSKFVTATGACGGAEPDVVLSLQKSDSFLARNLYFGDACPPLTETFIKSLFLQGSTSEV